MPAQVGRLEGDDDEVAEPSGDLLVAAGTEVALAGLERLNAPYLELAL